MRAPRIHVWAVALFTGSVLSFVIGFLGWILTQSDLPPYGGGIVELVVVPVALVWILVFGTVLIGQRISVRKEAEEEASKRNLEALRKILEKDEGKKI